MDRPRPDDFLELVERGRRGRLKVYLGYAAGVGKTFRMLEEAHGLRKRGVDIVVGFIETHGRADTAALLDGLEEVPRRRIEYRGIAIEEMDLDAVLARQPQVAIVDEIAHTNAPGSTHRKRYEDVVTLLDAGINVIAAFNVQHLQSLNDLVQRTTGVGVRETIPDAFLKQADQVVTLDLAIEDLLERLRGGKIYAPEKIPWALEHFFRQENLATLRELTLREVVESVERAAAGPRVEDGARTPPPADRVLACLAPDTPNAATLVRRASRMAGRLNTDWYVSFVETPATAPERIDATEQRRLHDHLEMAREMGAQVVHLKSTDPVAAILDFARSHRVGHVLLGRSGKPHWKRWLRRDTVTRVLDAAPEIDVLVVASTPARTES